MSINFRVKPSNSPFCINGTLINEHFSQKVTNFDKCTNNNVKTDIKIDEWTIIDLINSCSCERTREKLSNLYANHIQKSVAINEAMKMYLGLSANEATVLGAIYIPTAKSGRGYLSNKMIMYNTGLSKSTVKRALRKFEAKGLIETEYKRDEDNKMKVTRNYTFTKSFYASAKVTGCYTIQTPEVEDSGEIHEMSTKPIISQVSNWNLNNNIYTSTTKSNYSQNKLLLVSKYKYKNKLDTSINLEPNTKNKTSNLDTHVKIENLNTQELEVNANASNLEYSDEKQDHEMIAKKRFKLDSYDKVIEDFVGKNYKKYNQAIISGLKSMLQTWYSSYKPIKNTRLKLTNDQLKDKLKILFKATKGDPILTLISVQNSKAHNYTEFYTPSKKVVLAYKDKLIDRVIKINKSHLIEKCPLNDPNDPIYKQVTDEIQYFIGQAYSMESKWSKLKHGKLSNIGNNTHLINGESNIYADSSNTLNGLKNIESCEYGEPTYDIEKYENMNVINYYENTKDSLKDTSINNEQTNQNRLTKEGIRSIEDQLVKGNQHDCAFTLDEYDQDTENNSQSVLKSDQSKQDSKLEEDGYIHTYPPDSAAPPFHYVEDANLIDGESAIKLGIKDQFEIEGQNNRFKGDLGGGCKTSAETDKNASNELKSTQNEHHTQDMAKYLLETWSKPTLEEKLKRLSEECQSAKLKYYGKINVESVEKLLFESQKERYCDNLTLAFRLSGQAEIELNLCIRKAKKLISDEAKEQERITAECNKKYEEELKAYAHNMIEKAKANLMGSKNQPDLSTKPQKFERPDENLTDEEWLKSAQEIIERKRKSLLAGEN